MRLPDRSCEQCERRFTPSRRQQRFCTGSCRAKAAKARRRGQARPPAEQPLVVAVRTELEAAGAAESFLGQLALVLAGRLATESGLLSVSRELRGVMAEALDRTATPPEPEQVPEESEEPDELASLREERDRIARHAAAGRA